MAETEQSLLPCTPIAEFCPIVFLDEGDFEIVRQALPHALKRRATPESTLAEVEDIKARHRAETGEYVFTDKETLAGVAVCTARHTCVRAAREILKEK